MLGSYDLDLVVMSIVVAMAASYSALELAGRVTASAGRSSKLWMLGGAVVMGAGIWAMHFIGMLAFKLPIRMGYDVALTAFSMLIAMATSGFALRLVSGKELRLPSLLVGGVYMGAGICAMHYTGMEAMQMQPPIDYDPLLFSASVLVAVTASIAALWLAFSLRADRVLHAFEFRLMAAAVMGFAITGMHYTGMAAARFAPDTRCGVDTATFDPAMLGYGIGVAMVVIVGVIVRTTRHGLRSPFSAAASPEQVQRREFEVRLIRAGGVALGVAISLLAAYATWTVASKRVETNFLEVSRDHAHDIIDSFEVSMQAVESLGTFFSASHKGVTRQEFRTFATHLLARTPWASELEWVRWVRGEDRLPFETAMRQQYPAFQITESDAQTGTVTAGLRDEYFLVEYVEPYPGNEDEVGFDRGSETGHREAMSYARDTGTLVSAGGVRTGPQAGTFQVMVFMPVYAIGAPRDSVEQRRANLLGFAAGEFRAGDLVAQSIAKRSFAGLDLQIYQGPAAIPERLLYTHYSRARPPGPAVVSATGRRTTIAFESGGKYWTYVAIAAPGQHEADLWGALLVLLGGLAATAFVEATVRMKNSVIKLGQARGELTSNLSALKFSEDRFRTLVEQAGDGIALYSQQGKLLDANQRTLDLFGYTREDYLGASVDSFVAESERAKVWPELANVMAGREYQSEWQMQRKDGTTFAGEINAKLLSDGRVLMILREITERKVQEEKLSRLGRIHAVVSGINSLIVRCRDRQELFNGICRLLVERGHFKMVWIGLLKNEEVRPMAFHGDDGGVLKSLRISMRADVVGSENSGGPTAQALREQQPVVCNDIAHDERMQQWHQASRDHGLGSMLVLPLYIAKQMSGCFVLYAADPGYFDDEETKLLTELAANVSYAMEFIATEERLDFLAYYDPLTRLANRRQLIERLVTFAQTARQTRKLLAVLQLNLENFKFINDSVGRKGGDEILKQVAQRLTEIVGNTSHIARSAGDHFVVVMDAFQDSAEVVRFIEQDLLPQLSRPMTAGGRELRLAVRIGIARFDQDGDDPESLLRNAEAAMKKARLGTERYVFYTQEMGSTMSEKVTLETQLRRAVEKQEFVLYYQPKVDLRDGSVVGAEALIRWNSPELGQVPPTRFIPLMEETGMIVEVGRWAMEQAIRDHQRWLEQGLPAIPVAVNVSPVQLRHKDFVAVVRDVLTRLADGRPCLDLEITESTLVGDTEDHIVKLKAVRDLGVQIAIDDFGTGYSSLSNLVRLPINTLKIDRSFVLTMTDSADTMSVVSTIMALAHSMRLKVVAEGVDSQEQLKFLRLLRCDQIQGWLFSKALPADEFAQLLREARKL